MDKKEFILDNQGQAFTLDVMLALVIITIIIGISADAIDIASYKSADYLARFSMERVSNDAADMLIKTPGSPDNWESSIITHLTTPGLALIDLTGRIIPNTLSLKKINALKNNYTLLIDGKVLPHGVNSSLMIYPSNPSLSPIIIMNRSPENAVEVAVANRTVIFDFLDIEAAVYNNSTTICHNHVGLNWTCQYFNITRSELDSRNFYVITVPANIGNNSSSWIIDRPATNSTGTERNFSSTPINVNEKISNLLGNDTKGVLWFHVRTPRNKDRNFNAYIVSVPKEVPKEHVSFNLTPEPWFFVLSIWY